MSNTVKAAAEKLEDVLNNTNFDGQPYAKELIEEVVKFLKSKDILLIEWSTEDVILRAKDLNENDPDYKVPSKEQAREILSNLDDNQDCNFGITWDHIDSETQNIVND